MALNYLHNTPVDFYNILVCVDSKSVLMALKHWKGKMRNDIIFEIKFLIHCIISRGIGLDFCWVPSHCGLFWNERVDFLARRGALGNNNETVHSNLSLSSCEIISIIANSVHSNFFKTHFESLPCTRKIEILIYKLRLNAWNTKFSKDVTCICAKRISVHHLLFECPVLRNLYKSKEIDVCAKYTDVHKVLHDSQQYVASVAEIIYHSPVGKLL